MNSTILSRMKSQTMTRNIKATSTVKISRPNASFKHLVLPRIGSRSPVRENSKRLDKPISRSPISQVMVPSDFQSSKVFEAIEENIGQLMNKYFMKSSILN